RHRFRRGRRFGRPRDRFLHNEAYRPAEGHRREAARAGREAGSLRFADAYRPWVGGIILNWVGVVLRIALFLTIVSFAGGACSFVVTTDPYTAGWGSAKKYCQLDTGDFACVDKTAPAYGCARDGCIPCAPDHVAVAGCDPMGACAI